MSSSTFFKNIKKMYIGKTYFDKYGGDLWLCFILITLFTAISTYFHVSGQIDSLKTSWVDNKCNPQYMPFANIMNTDKNVSALEYTEQNFTSCIGDMFKEIMKIVMQPLILALQMISQAIEAMVALFDELGVAIAAMIKFILSLFATLMQILANLVNVVKNFFHDIGQINGQVLGITGVISAIARAFFTAFGSLLAYIFHILITICRDVMYITIAALVLAVGRLIWGIVKFAEGLGEDAEGAVEESNPFTLAAGIAMMIKGVYDGVTGTIKIVMGALGIVAAIIIIVICLFFIDLLLSIYEGIIAPMTELAIA